MTTHYLPDANEPALQPFTQTFVGMMFAHAAFEHRVSDLMEVITGVKGFGDRSENQWKVDDRPRRMMVRSTNPHFSAIDWLWAELMGCGCVAAPPNLRSAMFSTSVRGVPAAAA